MMWINQNLQRNLNHEIADGETHIQLNHGQQRSSRQLPVPVTMDVGNHEEDRMQ